MPKLEIDDMRTYVEVTVACTVLVLLEVVQSAETVIVVVLVLVLTPLTWMYDEQKDAPVDRLSRTERA
jgi:hypothetical protein